MPGRSTSRPLASVLGVVVLLVAVALVGAVRPTTAAATPFCPTMQIFGVRGSGETADDGAGYGNTVKAVVDRVRALVPTASATAIDYPAIPVELWKPTYYTGNYTKSVRSGVATLTNAIRRFINSPCGSTTRVYLVGFSQGAQVVGDAYQGISVPSPTTALSDDERARVAGVVMVADPKFKGAQASPVDVGDYATNLNGVATVARATSPRDVPASQAAYVRSFCDGSDVVCNFTKTNAAACLAAGDDCPHLKYAVLMPEGGAISYTDLAGNFLAGRWKLFGPPAPAVGPRSTVLLYGNYSAQEGRINIANSLTAAGYTVTVADVLPADLSVYGQVWWYGLTQSSDDQQAMITYARAGGSVYISGEWARCGCNQAATANVFDSLVVSVGGLQFGPDLSSGADVAFANRGVKDGAAKSPNVLTDYQSNAIGTMKSNVGKQHFVFLDGTLKYGTVGVWDNTDVVGGGRLLINMDVNWAEPSDGADPARIGPLTSNFAYFLSGATSRPAKTGTPTIVTGTARSGSKTTVAR